MNLLQNRVGSVFGSAIRSINILISIIFFIITIILNHYPINKQFINNYSHQISLILGGIIAGLIMNYVFVKPADKEA